MAHFICVTCGTQFDATLVEPNACPICLDERQYVGHSGQKWTTLNEYKKTHRNLFTEEADLHSIHPQPKAGIGQRAFVVRTKEGNVLWDCVPPLDDATVEAVNRRRSSPRSRSPRPAAGGQTPLPACRCP
jgi:hypothetical protein